MDREILTETNVGGEGIRARLAVEFSRIHPRRPTLVTMLVVTRRSLKRFSAGSSYLVNQSST